MDKYDVAVVGGGPVGGNVAKSIEKKKHKVVIFEQNKRIGEPLRCAGLVTPRVFDFLDCPKEKIIHHVTVVIDEVDFENWGGGGVQVSPEMLKTLLES